MKRTARMYTAKDVARICGVVNQTVINWIEKGQFSGEMARTPGGKFRIPARTVRAFLSEHGYPIPEEMNEASEVQA